MTAKNYFCLICEFSGIEILSRKNGYYRLLLMNISRLRQLMGMRSCYRKIMWKVVISCEFQYLFSETIGVFSFENPQNFKEVAIHLLSLNFGSERI